MKFWDPSALLPLSLIERQSKVLKKLIGEDEAIVAWWGTPVKCLSALARLRWEQAGRVLRLHPLRAADALQLAAALVWCQGDPSQHAFVCLDHRLRDAARREGFTIIPTM